MFLNKAEIMYKMANNIIPPYVCDLFQRRSDSKINKTLRSISNENFVVPIPNLSIFKEYSGSVFWNSIPRVNLLYFKRIYSASEIWRSFFSLHNK